VADVLILVRHGQTEANARGLMCGHADHPLTPTGHRQAERLAVALPRPTRLVSSPLDRARRTAEVIGRAAGLGPADIETDARWIEMDYGDLDGHPQCALDGDAWATWRDDPDHVPAGGESVADVGRRVRSACDDLAGDAARGDVVVVTHVSPIKAAIAWALGVGDEVAWRMFVVDAAVCRIDTAGSAPRLLAFNDAGPYAGSDEPCPESVGASMGDPVDTGRA
jgi:broad specificity phosphatase PhoE